MLERVSDPVVMPETIADGVYFNLSADDYHRDPALGSTDVGLLLKHPGDYWWQSWMNPQHEYQKTDFQEWGQAFHALIVEGESSFDARYFRGPSKDDHPGVLVKVDELKKWLSLRGYSVQGLKETLEKRVLSADPDAPVWSEIERKAEVQAEGRVVLDPRTYDQIVLSSGYITRNPRCAKAFANGYPEVSIFWTVGDMDVESVGTWKLRCKCRIDYLKYHALVDLKSIRHWRKMTEFEIAIFQSITNYGYDIQAAHYCNGRERMPELIRAGNVYGDVEVSWIKRFLELSGDPFRFVWIFYQAEGAPIAKRVDYIPQADYHFAAVSDINRALERYRRYMSVFGVSQWVDVSEPRILTNEDLRTRLAAIV